MFEVENFLLGVFIVNFEPFSSVSIATLNKYMLAGYSLLVTLS